MPKIIVFTAGKKHVYTGTADLHGIVAFVNRASGVSARAAQGGSDDWLELEGGGEAAELEADMRPHFFFRQQDGVQVMSAVSHGAIHPSIYWGGDDSSFTRANVYMKLTCRFFGE